MATSVAAGALAPSVLGLLASWLLMLPPAVAAPTAAAPGAAPTAVPAAASAAPTQVSVASANLREGSWVHRGTDAVDGDDRRTFARRLLGRATKVPDVVLLQEVLGSAGRVVRTLNRHPRAQRAQASYVLATGPEMRPGDGDCDGPRTAVHQIIRDSAIVVNQHTVQVHQQGAVRTWGEWLDFSFHCAEQPWVHVTVQDEGMAPREAFVAGLHVAPVGNALKTRAVTQTADALRLARQQSPGALLVLGGDLNVVRCEGSFTQPETAACPVRSAHRHLLDAGLRDAVRSQHLRGSEGVVGVRRRLDFLYTDGTVDYAWFDRCYLAYAVASWPCEPLEAQFAEAARMRRCQFRVTNFGLAGGRCSGEGYRRYYSDHPIVRATVG